MAIFRRPKIFTGRQEVAIRNQGMECIITFKTSRGTINLEFDKGVLEQLREMAHEHDDQILKYRLEKEYKISIVFE